MVLLRRDSRGLVSATRRNGENLDFEVVPWAFMINVTVSSLGIVNIFEVTQIIVSLDSQS